MNGLASRLSERIQLTSDGITVYLAAVEWAFERRSTMDNCQKIYADTTEGQNRDSPGQCIDCKLLPMIGELDPAHVSTSFVERHNLSVGMTNRRYTRLTNAFSKKIENHSAAVALGYFAYNFIKIHRTLRCTPAMAAGVYQSALGSIRLDSAS
jgi:hypothetical protein